MHWAAHRRSAGNPLPERRLRQRQQPIFLSPELRFFEPSKVMPSITKAPCTWDIYSLNDADEMLYGALTRKTWDKKTTSKKYTAG
jgi:hypothetical protein